MLEGQTPSGPSEKTQITLAFSIIVLIAILILAALYVSPEIPAQTSITEVSTYNYGESYRAGTFFDYAASGTYNNTTIEGTYHLHMVLYSNGLLAKYGWLNSTIPELNQMMNDYSGDGPYPAAGPFPDLDFTNVYVDGMGIGNISTAYGSKVVIQQVSIHEGWLIVYYTGWNPCVVYGCTATGPNFRLDLRLSLTNDQFAIDNNTSPIKLATTAHYHGLGEYGGLGAEFNGNGSEPFDFYTANGTNLHYNITATDVNMYAWSESDILVMIDGGAYTYNTNMTRYHLGNTTGVEELSPGHFYILLVGYQEGDSVIRYQGILDPYFQGTWSLFDNLHV